MDRRGLALALLPERRERNDRAGTALRVPWRRLEGLRADGTAPAPDGRMVQTLELATGSGALTLLVPAADVAVLLAAVGRWSHWWRWSRRPFVLVATDRPAALAGWLLQAAATQSRVARRRLAARWPGWSRLPRPHAAPLLSGFVSLAVMVAAVVALVATGTVASGTSGSDQARLDPSSMAGILHKLGADEVTRLKPAAAPPAAAPPSLADQPPLRPHEVFGFAPYWTLAQSGSFDVTKVTTLAYFAVGVNPDGTLDRTGSGWNGYQSQALADLVTRAHAAGDRVVLTVNCFDQRALDQLTSSPTAPATLSAALVAAIRAKNLDGVNLDLEGQGGNDRQGLTSLVAQVSTALHTADPHWQVTVDTYASSAGDQAGFYDIPALAPWVDGFFVMAYQLNLQGSPSSLSPLTSPMFSDLATAIQYAAAVPPSKVVLGLPFYGYEWPTTDGTLSAQATGPATPITYAQIAARGSPTYWDPVTDTAWTSYRVGTQWYEDFYESPSSLYLAAEMAQRYGFAGVGAWALGMEGNDPTMLAALDGLAPPAQELGTGPLHLPPIPGPLVAASPPPPTTSPPASASSTTTTTTTAPPPTSTTPTGSGSSTSTSTTRPPGSTTTMGNASSSADLGTAAPASTSSTSSTSSTAASP